MKVEFEFVLLPPPMPNIIRVKPPLEIIEEEGHEDMGVNVNDLTEQQAHEYADMIRATFIEHWKTRKKLKGGADDTK